MNTMAGYMQGHGLDCEFDGCALLPACGIAEAMDAAGVDNWLCPAEVQDPPPAPAAA